MVLPAPGSSARRNRSGVRGSSSLYTARNWWGSGSTSHVLTAEIGSNRAALRIRSASVASLKAAESASSAYVRERRRNTQPRLVIPVPHLLAQAAITATEGHRHRIGADPGHLHDRDRLRAGDASQERPLGDCSSRTPMPL